MNPLVHRQLIRPMRLTLAAAFVLLAAGCSQRPVADAPSLETLAGGPAAANWAALSPQAALLRLPDGRDAAIGLRERRQGQGVTQEIELPARGGAGRSLLTIALHGDAAAPGLYPGKPSEAGIRAEIAAAFPGRSFRVVVKPRRNAFGAYGLAVSAGADGQRCVYAWQWLDGGERRVRETLGGSASWRARLCRRNQNLDEIAAALDQIAIGLQPDVVIAPQPVRAAPLKLAHKPVARTKSAPRQIRAAEPASAMPTVAPGGQRYLAAVPAQPPVPASMGAPQAALDQSLPAEAYRGPSARNAPVRRIALHDPAAVRVVVPGPN